MEATNPIAPAAQKPPQTTEPATDNQATATTPVRHRAGSTVAIVVYTVNKAGRVREKEIYLAEGYDVPEGIDRAIGTIRLPLRSIAFGRKAISAWLKNALAQQIGGVA